MLDRAFVALASLSFATPVFAQGWPNSGGAPERNGRTFEVGPETPSVLWSGGRSSIIAWQPVIEDRRVFLVRQTGFPPSGEPNGSPVVCMDLDTGAELWFAHLPFNPGDWTTWVAGVKNGRVYASRSGNGASVHAKLHCLDAVTGATLWQSTDLIDAGAYDGVVFADDGDPIVGSFRDIWRIDALNGTTVWHATRTGSVSGNCGVARHGDALYAVDTVAGGQVVKRFDANTGAFQYQSSLMPGFLVQNTPFVGRDGTIYFQRVQNNVAVDFFYAFHDTGSSIVENWHVTAGYGTRMELGVGPDDTVYMVEPGKQLTRLDPATGAALGTTGAQTVDFFEPRIATDALGRVYMNNGGFTGGAFTCWEADLTPRWSLSVPNANIGSPAIGADGTLVVAGIGTSVVAYRATPPMTPFCAGDGLDPSHTSDCPCANHGDRGRGCANSVNSSGALLLASGRPALDTVVLNGLGMPATVACIYRQGDALDDALFGDGVRCTGGTLLRLRTRVNVAGASRFPDSTDTVTLSARGSTPPGSGLTAYYQTYYRNASASFCPPETFNVSNGYQITW